MKMKIAMIAALAAAPVPAAAQPADPPRQERRLSAGEAEALRAVAEPDSSREAASREDRPRKRKSTGDKILTGAAIVLGVGAVAVGGLLIAIFAG